MDLGIPGYGLRPPRRGDAPSLARHADDPQVARHLRDRFPHPYRAEHAEAFLTAVMSGDPDGERVWIVTRDDAAVGVVGAVPGTDVHRGTYEIGYWLGRAHWGRGVVTAAVRAVAELLLAEPGTRRLWASVFAGNPASERVLIKAGFAREGVLRAAACKRGEIRDEIVYARLAGP